MTPEGSYCVVVVALGRDPEPETGTWGLIWYPGTYNWLWIDFSVYTLHDAQRRGAWGHIKEDDDDATFGRGID